jgi:hypothetical protein
METIEAGADERRHTHFITVFVDAEPYPITDRVMTPNDIIRLLAKQDPATHYLVQIEKGHQLRSFQGKGDERIELVDGEKFQVISTGATPVSDHGANFGVDLFIDGLRSLGFVPATLPGKPDHVVLDYPVECGKFAGRQIKLGLVVPADFPLSAPGGPHVSPHIHPIQTSGDHPTGGVHLEHAKPFQEALGGDWQYWSRPCLGWGQNRKTVAAYMSHIWRLWNSQ